MNRRGSSLIEELEWDSRMLGMKAARVREPFKAKDLRKVLAVARARGIQYLTCRVEMADWDSVQYLLANGFEMVDLLVRWQAAPRPAIRRQSGGVTVRPHRESDIPRLAVIARKSFSRDRFHADPAVSRAQADRIHAEWIINSCRGRAAAVLVAELDGLPRGFIAVNRVCREGETIGIIDLIAVDAAYRKHRLGSRLVEAALGYFRGTAARVEVGTQLSNIPAWRLYQQAGFRLESSSATLRALLK